MKWGPGRTTRLEQRGSARGRPRWWAPLDSGSTAT
jgi:hypothetical protein